MTTHDGAIGDARKRQQAASNSESIAGAPNTPSPGSSATDTTKGAQIANLARLAEIKQRADAATEGPWGVDEIARVWAVRDPAGWDAFHVAVCHDAVGRATDANETDAAFIAAARTDIPWLLDELARVTSERDGWRDKAGAWQPSDDQILAVTKRAEAAEAAIERVRALVGEARREWREDGCRGPAVLTLPDVLAALDADPTEGSEQS